MHKSINPKRKNKMENACVQFCSGLGLIPCDFSTQSINHLTNCPLPSPVHELAPFDPKKKKKRVSGWQFNNERSCVDNCERVAFGALSHYTEPGVGQSNCPSSILLCPKSTASHLWQKKNRGNWVKNQNKTPQKFCQHPQQQLEQLEQQQTASFSHALWTLAGIRSASVFEVQVQHPLTRKKKHNEPLP